MQSENQMKIWLSRRAFDRIQSDAKRYFPLETGGVLLGWRNGLDRTIVDVIGAGPNALHGRVRFVPDHKWQIRQLTDAFCLSGGDLDYLGDWHTHPDGLPQMSDTDRVTLRRISRSVADPIMLIAAGNSVGGWSMAAWLQQKPRWRILQPACESRLQIFDAPSQWPSYRSDDAEP